MSGMSTMSTMSTYLPPCLGSLALALALAPASAAAGAANPFGVERRGGNEIAALQSAAPGSLSIPNLRRSSPRTLAALIERGNVELPPIEAIELIPEPGGSFGDDFVIPEDFPARTRR
jgi:hypothetical protein